MSATMAGKAYVLLTLRDNVTQSLKAAEKKFQEFGTSVSISSGLAFAGSSAAIAWPLKLSSDMEQVTTSFRVFLGSADKATALVKTLDQISIETPYELADLAESARLMLASRLSDTQLPDMLAMIGDIAQGDKDALYLLSKAFADSTQKGKLMAQELNQFLNSGFNPLMIMAEENVKKFGGTVDQHMNSLYKQMENGAISVFDIAEAMRIATSEGGRFHGMQVEQAQTLKGLVSTLWDYINRGLRSFGDALLPIAKEFVRIGIGITNYISALGNRFKWLLRIVGIAIAVFAGIMFVFTMIGGTVLTLSFAFGMLASIIGVVFSQTFLILMAVAAAIGIVAAIVYYFRNEIYGLANAMYMLWQPVIDSMYEIGQIINDTMYAIIEALGQGKIEEAAQIAMLGMQAIFWEGVSGAALAIDWFLGEIGRIVPYFDYVVTGISLAMGSIYAAILAGRLDLAWSIVSNTIQQQIQLMINFVSNGFNAVLLGVKTLATTIKFAVLNVLNTMALGFEIAVFGMKKSLQLLVVGLKKALDVIGQGQLVAGIAESLDPGTLQEIVAKRKKIGDDLANQQRNEQFGNAMNFANKVVENERKIADLREKGAWFADQARKAQEASGIENFQDKAQQARKDLNKAIQAVKRPAVDPKNTKNPIQRANDMLSQDAMLGKYMKSNARGTFSAIASTYLGREATDYDKQTAKNTKETADAVKNMGVVFA